MHLSYAIMRRLRGSPIMSFAFGIARHMPEGDSALNKGDWWIYSYDGQQNSARKEKLLQSLCNLYKGCLLQY